MESLASSPGLTPISRMLTNVIPGKQQMVVSALGFIGRGSLPPTEETWVEFGLAQPQLLQALGK